MEEKNKGVFYGNGGNGGVFNLQEQSADGTFFIQHLWCGSLLVLLFSTDFIGGY